MKQIKPIYINCEKEYTEYKIIGNIARYFNKKIPRTGLALDEVYYLMLKQIEKLKDMNLVIVLDNIEKLEKKLYPALRKMFNILDLEFPDVNIVFVGI